MFGQIAKFISLLHNAIAVKDSYDKLASQKANGELKKRQLLLPAIIIATLIYFLIVISSMVACSQQDDEPFSECFTEVSDEISIPVPDI